jgi:cytochrome c
MKRGAYVLLTAVLALGMTAPCMAASVEEGKKLFSATDMGSNGKSCATCHPGGKGIGDLSGMDQEELAAAVNACVTSALEGKALPEDSEELHSLNFYLRSLNAGSRGNSNLTPARP